MVKEEEVLKAHKSAKGKVEIVSKVPLLTIEDMSTYYTPGVAYVSEAIKKEKELVYSYTDKSNSVAIVSDGTRILGLGNIGAEAGMPVMEGKAILFKKFGGIDAVPLCIGTTDENEIQNFIRHITPTFGAVNIEDIESPKCFRILDRLTGAIDIPVFHDDRQGTSVVVLAALLNSLKLAGKGKGSKIIIDGAGSAGYGIVEILHFSGFRNVYVLDRAGLISSDRKEHMNEYKEKIAGMTNPERKSGSLDEAVVNADILIGVSGTGRFGKDIIAKMSEKPILFALSNPLPEISYEEAKEAGAFIAATGRSDTPNQVNNLLSFPGVLRGALDIRAKSINSKMLYAAAVALSRSTGKGLSTERVLPNITERGAALRIVPNVAAAVAAAAIETGAARLARDGEGIKKGAKDMIKRYARLEKRLMQSAQEKA